MNGIEHTRKKSGRHDEEILETGKLVIFVSPYSGDDTHGAQNCGAEKGKEQNSEGEYCDRSVNAEKLNSQEFFYQEAYDMENGR